MVESAAIFRWFHSLDNFTKQVQLETRIELKLPDSGSLE